MFNLVNEKSYNDIFHEYLPSKILLFRYGLSYLQSLLLVNTAKRSPKMTEEPIDINDLSTIDILTKAR